MSKIGSKRGRKRGPSSTREPAVGVRMGRKRGQVRDPGEERASKAALLEGTGGAGKRKVEVGRRVKEHPLCNPVVLRSLFQYGLSLEEVKRNRLVCNSWRDASNLRWTKLTKTLTLIRGQEGEGENVKTLEQMWELCRTSQGPLDKVTPYRKFSFHRWTFDEALQSSLTAREGEGLPSAEKFLWNRIGPCLITELSLDKCHFPEDFTVFTADFLKALPLLVKLVIQNCTATDKALSDSGATYRNLVIGLRRLGDEANGLEPEPGVEFWHPTLKYLRVVASERQNYMAQKLIGFLKMAPNLETLVLGGFDVSELSLFLQFLAQSTATIRHLKKLDILDLSGKAQTYGVVGGGSAVRYDFQGLRSVHYDIGYESGYAGGDLNCIMYNMPAVEELSLYRAPFMEPYLDIFSWRSILLARIKELHLWGNVVGSLDFLRLCSDLKTLVWNTSCYEDQYHGKRTYQVLQIRGRPTFPLMEHDLVKNTGVVVPPLWNLTKLEIDWRPACPQSWKQLGGWMPNLTCLKVKIMNQRELSHVRVQWPNLEIFELGHGSLIPGEVMLKDLAKFKKLKKVTWQQCPCNERRWSGIHFQNILDWEQTLGFQLQRKEVPPWNQLDPAGGNVWNYCGRTRSGGRKVCIQAEFVKMLKTGDAREYVRMMNSPQL